MTPPQHPPYAGLCGGCGAFLYAPAGQSHSGRLVDALGGTGRSGCHLTGHRLAPASPAAAHTEAWPVGNGRGGR